MDPKVTAAEIMIRVLASCDWTGASGAMDESKRGDAPRMHLVEAGYSLKYLMEWVQRGGFRPKASDVLDAVLAYYESQGGK